jgi:phosphoglycolate phosphatase-like HAD superfamily hydrolase
MPRRSKQKPDNQAQTLILLDHDGTLCNTNLNAFDSMKYAARTACESIKVDYDKLNLDWDKLTSETRGTTEKNLVKHICYEYEIPYKQSELFEERFYIARANWYTNMKSYNEYIYDSYFPDAETLIHQSYKDPTKVIWLITGNPKVVVAERLAPHIRKYFTDKNGDLLGAFGNEALSRAELIHLAINRATKSLPNFQPKKNGLGFTTNVIYIGDGRHDFFAGLEAKVRTVWIPSRLLQEVKENLALDYNRFLKSLLPTQIEITNDLSCPNTLSFLGLNPDLY